MFGKILNRLKTLILAPKTEWEVIAGEDVSVGELYKFWIMPLSAIPAIASFIGLSIVGVLSFRVPFMSGLWTMVVSFALGLAGIYVFALIIDNLAPKFGAEKNFKQAFKVAAYAPAAAWVASIFNIIPSLGIIALVGAVYTLYLLFIGLPILMKPNENKGTTYTLASIGVLIVVALIISFVAAAVAPTTITLSTTQQQLSRDLQKAAEAGDFAAILSAATGSTEDAIIVDSDALKNLIPDEIANLDRTSLNIRKTNAPFQMTVATAKYGDDSKNITLTITNSKAIAAFKGLATFAGATVDKETDDGYKRLRREGDVMIMEEWSNSRNRGEYGRIFSSFSVEATGTGVTMDDLIDAVDEIDQDDLENLPPAA